MDAQKLLETYLDTPGEEHQEPLSAVVRDLVHRSVARREVGDLEDFEEDCVLAIWTKIGAMKAGESDTGIDNLEAFVRRAVHNRYCDAIRRKRPAWYNLKLEFLEIFAGKSNVSGLALWQHPSSGARMCGYADWTGSSRSASARCREILDDVPTFRSRHLDNREPEELPSFELAAAVLDFCGGPVDIDALTSCVAQLLHTQTADPLSIDAQPDADEDAGAPVDWLISPDTDVEKQVVDDGWFQHVIDWFWKEFIQLSVKQRKALLFGLSTEQMMAMVAAVGMAEVSRSVEMEPAALAARINDLPLPDAVTAQELGVEPRAVPSVRFKAWGRIRRRTKKSALLEEDESALI